MGKTTIAIGEDVEEEDPFEEHPLFPLDEGQRGYDVSFIQITRFEEGLQKWGPCVRAEELRGEADIIERFGGGQYVLVARKASKIEGVPGRISKNRRINLPGLPRPLSADPTPNEARMSNPNAPPPNQPAANGQPAMVNDPMSFFGMMMQMQTAAVEKERIASEKAAQQNQQFMQMFMTIMQGSKADSQNMMQMMMTMNSQQQQGMLQFITAMMGSRGGGPEEFAKYAELIRALTPGEKKDPAKEGDGQSISAMLENAADLVQGIVQLKGSMGGGPTGPTIGPSHEQPVLPPGVGGAAALLRGR